MSEINSFSDYTNQILVHCNLFLRATIPMQAKYRRKQLVYRMLQTGRVQPIQIMVHTLRRILL